MSQPIDLRVDVDAAPEPGFLRPAIEAALAGRPWPPGPEAQIAAAVSAAVAARASSNLSKETPTSQDKPSLANRGFPDGAGKSRSAR